MLSDEERKRFHSRFAKAHYLGIKTQPEIILASSFLNHRLIKPTEEEGEKLERLLKHLNGSKDVKIFISPSCEGEIECFVDASFAKHENAHSHTGAMRLLGGTPIAFKSSKQKILTLNSTEAELVALSDRAPDAVELADFMEGQGCMRIRLEVYQDNEPVLNIARADSKLQRKKYMRGY